MPMCPGTIVLNEFAIAISGLEMSSSFIPSARRRPLAAALDMPFFIASLLSPSPFLSCGMDVTPPA